MPIQPKTLPPSARWVIWAALSGSAVFYFLILRAGLIETQPEPVAEVLLPMSALGFVLAVSSMGIRFVVRNERDRDGRRTLPSWVNAAFIVALALAEATAICGFALGILGHGMKAILPLFAISLAAMLMNNPAGFFPRPDDES